MERLTKGNGNCAWVKYRGLWTEPNDLAISRDNTHTIGELIRRLAAYEETGRTPEEIQNAIFPPCEVGDTVYWIRGKAILEVYIQWFETNAYGWCACGTYPPMSTPTFRFADFGKTVFLTREEAEAALKKESKGEHNETDL